METRREKGKFYAADKEICHNDNTIILCTESTISAQFSGVVVKKGNNSTFGEFSHKWNTNHFDIEVDFLNQNTTSQQETIERLRELCRRAYTAIRHETNPSNSMLDVYFDIEKEVVLNTTEPIDQ